jgi:tRNA(fMet)-specific endonuclease VapC
MEPGSLALDTTAVVLHLRRKSVQVSNRLAAATELYIPVTALGELWFGVERSGNRRRASEPLERFLLDAVIIYPDDQTAKVYAHLKDHLSRQGTPIPDNDLWIAATAHGHQLPLFHDDAHFELLSSLIQLERP